MDVRIFPSSLYSSAAGTALTATDVYVYTRRDGEAERFADFREIQLIYVENFLE